MRKFGILAVIALLLLTMVPVSAQEDSGEMCVTINGKEVCGTTDDILTLLAATGTSAQNTEDSGPVEMQPMNIRSECFGVVDFLAGTDEFVLLETLNKTEYGKNAAGEDAILSIEPDTNNPEDHGDWPPHGLVQKFETSRRIGCSEVWWDISLKYHVEVETDMVLRYTFRLNPEYLNEYVVMASGGDLGLFIGSHDGIEVSINGGETRYLRSEDFCHDCVNHTQAEVVAADNIYEPSELSFIGDSEREAGLDQMIVVPVSRDPEATYVIEMRFEAGETATVWFGRFDVE